MPYDGGASAGSHPRKLATLGRVFGMSPASPSKCRVLELGCAVGTNLIHLAASLPDSEFVGIDLFESQIVEARKRAEALGLRNIRFEAADIMEFGGGEEPFDYILACGVFSWVPEAVQVRMLELCGQLLAPQGIAYITYNILPGWYMRLPVRELMIMAAGQGTVADRVRRAAGILDFVLRAASTSPDLGGREDRTWESIIRREREILDTMPAEYVAHEHLEENNRPIYFKDFVDMASAQGLQYLAESGVAQMFPLELEQDIQNELDRMTNSQVGLEQLLDFIRGRQFRQTLLCRSAVDVQRNLDGLRLDGMYLSVQGEIVQAETSDGPADVPRLRDGGATVRLGDPEVAAVIKTLVAAAPRQLSIDELLPRTLDGAHRARLEKILIKMFLSGIVRLEVEPTRLSTVIGERPRASRPAIVTRSREEVTNLLHQDVLLSPLASALIELLDGTRDRAAMLRDLRTGIAQEGPDGPLAGLLAEAGTLESTLEDALAEIRAKALLEPED